MRLEFRPIFGVTVAAAVLIAVLAGLGIWQVVRFIETGAAIERAAHAMAAPPLPLGKALAMGQAAEYHHVVLDGWFLHSGEAYVPAKAANGASVYHVLTPYKTAHGTLMVDRGYVSAGRRDPVTRALGQLKGARRVVGVWRLSEAPSKAPSDPAKHIYPVRDLAGIAEAEHLKLAAPYWIEANAAPNPGGWPKGGDPRDTLQNPYLSGALIWFALAGLVLGIYAAFHIRKGRLSLAARKAVDRI